MKKREKLKNVISLSENRLNASTDELLDIEVSDSGSIILERKGGRITIKAPIINKSSGTGSGGRITITAPILNNSSLGGPGSKDVVVVVPGTEF